MVIHQEDRYVRAVSGTDCIIRLLENAAYISSAASSLPAAHDTMILERAMSTSQDCTQCGRPAIITFGGNPLCVEHHLKMQQAIYLQHSQIAAHINYLSEEIARGTGYILPPNRIEIPRPPFLGDSLNLHNINVSNSTIGAVNTGTVEHLDAAITLFERRDEDELAAAIKEFTQALIDTNEIEASTINEIAEQLAFLVAQASAKPEDRSIRSSKKCFVRRSVRGKWCGISSHAMEQVRADF